MISPESILSACKDVGYHWRKRVLGPVETIHLFLLQVLLKNTACRRRIVQLGEWRFTDTAYCAARKRLPLALFHKLVEQTAGVLRRLGWLALVGIRVWTIDGIELFHARYSGASSTLRSALWPGKGCGFPVAKLLTLFHVIRACCCG